MEIEGREVLPIEEIHLATESDGRRTRHKRRMEQYAPLIFEECYVKHRGLTKVANAFELEQDKELAKKIDPTAGHKQQFEL